MASGFVIRKNQYYDSVFLMGVSKRLSDVKGVQQTAALMASEANKRLLADINIKGDEIKAAQPNDLIIAVVAETQTIVNEILNHLDRFLIVSSESKTITNINSLEDGLSEKPNSNLVLISTPSEYAAREAYKALEKGLNVFIFSDNVPIEDELRLKQLGKEKGLLVMGPDCGTSIINGIGIGFANVVRKGDIGVIASAGTGLQEFTSLVHSSGHGISHAIGTGSHDLSDKIGGLTTLLALSALEADPQTNVIALISKPPGEQTLAMLIQQIKACKKPIVVCMLGVNQKLDGSGSIFSQTCTIDEAVDLAIIKSSGISGELQKYLGSENSSLIVQETAKLNIEQKYLRGLFAGGTFCYQSQQIMRNAGILIYSNTPLDKKYQLEKPYQSLKNTFVDMGDDYFMVGKPHPMIDGFQRNLRILSEGKDPQVAVLLLDFILGYNASMDPVGDLLDAITEVKNIARQRGGYLSVVASICGTEGDVQDIKLQEKMLTEAGVIVFKSNASAAFFCQKLIKSIER